MKLGGIIAGILGISLSAATVVAAVKVIPFPISKKITTYSCTRDLYNCNNFITQKQAQSVMKYCNTKNKKKDIHRLDANKDGKACETLKK